MAGWDILLRWGEAVRAAVAPKDVARQGETVAQELTAMAGGRWNMLFWDAESGKLSRVSFWLDACLEKDGWCIRQTRLATGRSSEVQEIFSGLSLAKAARVLAFVSEEKERKLLPQGFHRAGRAPLVGRQAKPVEVVIACFGGAVLPQGQADRRRAVASAAPTPG